MPHPRPAGRLCFTSISLSHLVLSYIILYYLVLACIILYYLVLSCLIFYQLALSCTISYYLVLFRDIFVGRPSHGNALPVPSSYRFRPPLVFYVFYNGFCTFSVNKVSYFYKNGKNAWDIRTFWTYWFSLPCTSVFLALFHALPPPSFSLSSSSKTAKTLGTFDNFVPPCLQSPPRPST